MEIAIDLKVDDATRKTTSGTMILRSASFFPFCHLRDWLLSAKKKLQSTYIKQGLVRNRWEKNRNRQSTTPFCCSSLVACPLSVLTSNACFHQRQNIWLPTNSLYWIKRKKWANVVSVESFEQFPKPIPYELLFDGFGCYAKDEIRADCLVDRYLFSFFGRGKTVRFIDFLSFDGKCLKK